jgi:hypothetical protein
LKLGRLKWLLLCNSTIITPRPEWQEFYYHLLEDGKNVVMVEEMTANTTGPQVRAVQLALPRAWHCSVRRCPSTTRSSGLLC